MRKESLSRSEELVKRIHRIPSIEVPTMQVLNYAVEQLRESEARVPELQKELELEVSAHKDSVRTRMKAEARVAELEGGNWQANGFPPEGRTVLVWLRDKHLPFCGYMKCAAGEKDSPYWVVYHGNTDIGVDVVAWSDCLPAGPPGHEAGVYARGRKEGGA